MAKIYRVSDKIKLKVKDVEVEISPLTYHQKSEVQTILLEGTPMAIMSAARKALQFGLKSIKGFELEDGSDYELLMDDNGVSDESIDDLLNTHISEELQIICVNLINGIPSEFVDPQTGAKLDGVSFIKKAASGKKK